MPIVNRPPSADSEPNYVRPYLFHGVELTSQGNQYVGECPFCTKNKFSVEVATGKFKCWVCGVSGNPLSFLRQYHSARVTATPAAVLAQIAQDRRLLAPATTSAWGVCVDSGQTWLIPGYGTDGSLNQLYRRVWVRDEQTARWGMGIDGHTGYLVGRKAAPIAYASTGLRSNTTEGNRL